MTIYRMLKPQLLAALMHAEDWGARPIESNEKAADLPLEKIKTDPDTPDLIK